MHAVYVGCEDARARARKYSLINIRLKNAIKRGKICSIRTEITLYRVLSFSTIFRMTRGISKKFKFCRINKGLLRLHSAYSFSAGKSRDATVAA